MIISKNRKVKACCWWARWKKFRHLLRISNWPPLEIGLIKRNGLLFWNEEKCTRIEKCPNCGAKTIIEKED